MCYCEWEPAQCWCWRIRENNFICCFPFRTENIYYFFYSSGEFSGHGGEYCRGILCIFIFRHLFAWPVLNKNMVPCGWWRLRGIMVWSFTVNHIIIVLGAWLLNLGCRLIWFYYICGLFHGLNFIHCGDFITSKTKTVSSQIFVR